ncbi:CBS domain-containing protein [Aeoliella sp.]|uniref:CBS domain-containing protein n=1 Tax=Aeoliella sp. TaxID=2795800 RepID=UPI003CCC28C3
MLTAEQIMTPDVHTIGPESSIREAIEKLLDKRISGLPVVDRSGTLVGILSEYALLAMAYDKTVTHQTVAQHMTREVISVDAKAPVNRVADQFIVHRVRRLPVVKDGRLVGLISRVDVLKALYTAEAPVCSA